MHVQRKSHFCKIIDLRSATVRRNSRSSHLAKRNSDDSATVRLGEETYDLDLLTGSVGFLTRVVHIQIREFLRLNAELPISPGVYSALALLAANPGIRQGRVAQILAIQESNMATLVKQLSAAGLIERPPTTAGKRSSGLWLSDKGQTLLVKVKAAFNAVDRNYASALSTAEYADLTRLLSRLFQHTLRATLPAPVPNSESPRASPRQRTKGLRKRV